MVQRRGVWRSPGFRAGCPAGSRRHLRPTSRGLAVAAKYSSHPRPSLLRGFAESPRYDPARWNAGRGCSNHAVHLSMAAPHTRTFQAEVPLPALLSVTPPISSGGARSRR